MDHTPLSKHSGPFAVLVAVGVAVGAVAAHALALWFQIFPSDIASHRTAAGLALFGFVAVAVILTVLGLLAAVAWERHRQWGALVGAAAAGVVAMAVYGVGEARTWATMHNYRPEVRALSEFQAPAGWRPRFAKQVASAKPSAEQRWEAAGAIDDVRDAAIVAFTAWADPGSVTGRKTYGRDHTSVEARKGRDRAQLTVSPAYPEPSLVSVSLTVVRDARLVAAEARPSRLPPWQS